MSDLTNLLSPPAWALELLRCPTCDGMLREQDDLLACTGCARLFAVDRGVVDFLAELHPAVASERQAVAALDAGEVALPSAGPPGSALGPEEAFHRHVSQSRDELKRVLGDSPLEPEEIVVELGADSCWASPLFLEAGCRVVAIDITPHLHLAESADHAGLCRLQTDMNALPLASGCADVVWATAAAHHSWDLAKTFKEAARVLRPGGRLYFCCEPMPSWLRWPLGLAVGDAERALGIHETWVPRWRWLRVARAAGFDARLVFPALDDQQVTARLRERSVPSLLLPMVRAFVRPILRTVQVSMHLLGTLERSSS